MSGTGPGGSGLTRRSLAVSGGLAVLAARLRADAPDEGAAALAERLGEIRERHAVPGLWGGRFHLDGRSVVACSGVRREGGTEAVSICDPIHVGSCTKAMTAVMAARERTAGRLAPTATLGTLLPGEFAAGNAWADATVDDLLRHTSGAPANADWQALHRDHPLDAVAARRALAAWLAAQPRPPRRDFAYSNVGYAIVGHVVESLRGRAWEDLAAAEIFAPLGIAGGGFGPVPVDGSDGAWGHVLRDGKSVPVRVDNPPPLGPAGRVHLPIGEWAKFVLAFAGGGGAARASLGVAPADWDRLLDPGRGDYAGGWGIRRRRWGHGRVLTHSGSNTTWTCVAWVAPERDFCLLGATNTGAPAAASACDDAVAACLDDALLRFGPDGE